jgi:hypothetical protein
LLRWALGVALVSWSFRTLRAVLAGSHGTGLEALGVCFFGVIALLVVALLLSPEVRLLVSSLFTRLIDLIYLPGWGASVPLDYTLADLYQDKGRTEAAIREYLRLAHYHPQELRPYLEALKLSRQCGEVELAAKIYKTGLRRLRNQSAREALKKTYALYFETGAPG